MIIAARSAATECPDGALEFVVRVPAQYASALLESWPIDKHCSISMTQSTASPPTAQPETQTIDGAGGLDVSGFGSFAGAGSGREVFRARYVALLSDPAFQRDAENETPGPVDPFHSKRQIAQAWLTQRMKALKTDQERTHLFDRLCEQYIGNVTIDIED